MTNIITGEYHRKISIGDIVAPTIFNKRRGEKGKVVNCCVVQYDGYFKDVIVEFEDGQKLVFSQKHLVLFKDFKDNEKYI